MISQGTRDDTDEVLTERLDLLRFLHFLLCQQGGKNPLLLAFLAFSPAMTDSHPAVTGWLLIPLVNDRSGTDLPGSPMAAI
jgi:hypothetical protein